MVEGDEDDLGVGFVLVLATVGLLDDLEFAEALFGYFDSKVVDFLVEGVSVLISNCEPFDILSVSYYVSQFFHCYL